ncbi:MAG: MATE family efflux transporter [Firmicutes bacterium]|nr:MATE family efflux transporter [Bacillota bacterium]
MRLFQNNRLQQGPEAMANDPIRSLLMKMAGPSIVAMLMQAMYNTVDSMFVARISDGSLAAVTLAFPVQMIIGALSTGIGVGINSSIARSLGAKKPDQAGQAAVNGLMLGLGTVVIMILFAFLGAEAFVRMYTDDPEVLEGGVIYVRTISLLAFGAIFSQLTFSVLQGSGNMILPMISQLAGGVAVIVLDPILIFGAHMGVLGAAVASSTAQTFSMLIGMYGILKVNQKNLQVSFRGFRPSGAIMKDILYVGIPAALTQATTSIVAGIVTKQVAAYGTSAIAVYGAFNKLSTFTTLPVFGITRGMNPILGFCCGARKRGRFLETEKLAAIAADSWTSFSWLIFMIIPGLLLHLMNATDEMMEIGVTSFRLLALSQLIIGASIVMVQVFPPVKKSYISMTSALFRQLVLLLPLTILFSKAIGLYGIWIGICLADVLNFLYVIVMNVWLRRKVLADWDE